MYGEKIADMAGHPQLWTTVVILTTEELQAVHFKLIVNAKSEGVNVLDGTQPKAGLPNALSTESVQTDAKTVNNMAGLPVVVRSVPEGEVILTPPCLM